MPGMPPHLPGPASPVSDFRIKLLKWHIKARRWMVRNHAQMITDKFKQCGMYNATDGSENDKVKITGLGDLYDLDGNEEPGALEKFVTECADKHRSQAGLKRNILSDSDDSDDSDYEDVGNGDSDGDSDSATETDSDEYDGDSDEYDGDSATETDSTESMLLYVHCPRSGKLLCVRVPRKGKVGDIGPLVQEHTASWPLGNIRFRMEGMNLNNSQKLSDVPVPQGSTLKLFYQHAGD